MSILPAFKIGDCSRCPNKSVACKKRGKALLCLRCCNVDDNKKQISKAKERDNAIRAKISPSKTSRQSSLINSIEGQEGVDMSQWEWFKSIRPSMVGKCAHCGGKTPKDNATFYFSIAHILPKNKKYGFPSIAKHPNNWLELCSWGNNCHGNYDAKTLLITDLNCFDLLITRFQTFYQSIHKSELSHLPSILTPYIPKQ